MTEGTTGAAVETGRGDEGGGKTDGGPAAGGRGGKNCTETERKRMEGSKRPALAREVRHTEGDAKATPVRARH